MKRFLAIFIVAIVVLLCACSSANPTVRISPENIEFDVPMDGNTKVEFTVYDFSGDLAIYLEDMGLMRVYPETVHITALTEGTPVVLTIYGEPS